MKGTFEKPKSVSVFSKAQELLEMPEKTLFDVFNNTVER